MLVSGAVQKGVVCCIVVVLIFCSGVFTGYKIVKNAWDTAEKDRAVATQEAVVKRTLANEGLRKQQEAEKVAAAKGYHDAIEKLRRAYAVAASNRVRFQVRSGTASGTTKTNSTSGADGACTCELPQQTSAGLYDIARSCDEVATRLTSLQEWVRLNGMTP